MTPLEWLLAALVVGLALALWRQMGETARLRREATSRIKEQSKLFASMAAEHDRALLTIKRIEEVVRPMGVIITPEAHPGN